MKDLEDVVIVGPILHYVVSASIPMHLMNANVVMHPFAMTIKKDVSTVERNVWIVTKVTGIANIV